MTLFKAAHQYYRYKKISECLTTAAFATNGADGMAKDNMSSSLLQLNPLINVSHIRLLGRDPGQSLVRSQSQSIYTG